MARPFFFGLFLLLAHVSHAQINRYHIVPPKARVLPGTKPKPPEPDREPRPNMMYPAMAVRLGMKAVVRMTFTIGPDGRTSAVAFQRLDSLSTNGSKQEVAQFAESTRQQLIDEADKSLRALRLAPTDSVRHYEAAFRYDIQRAGQSVRVKRRR